MCVVSNDSFDDVIGQQIKHRCRQWKYWSKYHVCLQMMKRIKWSSAAKDRVIEYCKGSSDRVQQEDEDQSVATKDRVIECCKKMKIKVLLQRIEWSSAARRWTSKCYYKGSSDRVRQKMKTRCCRRWCSSTKDIEDVPVTVLVADVVEETSRW